MTTLWLIVIVNCQIHFFFVRSMKNFLIFLMDGTQECNPAQLLKFFTFFLPLSVVDIFELWGEVMPQRRPSLPLMS